MNDRLHEAAGRIERVVLLRRIEMQRQLPQTGLYRGQPPILRYITQNDGCSQKQVADAMGLTSSSVALSIKRMEKAGLIVRRAMQEDRRRNLLRATERGRRACAECGELFAELDTRTFAGFTDDELQALNRALDRIAANLAGPDGGRVCLGELFRRINIQEKNITDKEDGEC